jgi:hypothetical protein
VHPALNMNILSWFGFGKPTFAQVDKTASDTPPDAAAPLTRATYREVLLRGVDGTPEHEAATIATYVVVAREPDAAPSRVVFADV